MMPQDGEYDPLLRELAGYALDDGKGSDEARRMAAYVLVDALGCGLLALRHPACTRLLGPLVPGMSLARGARVPGTAYELDPVQAAFNIGAMIRWLDYNDTWLAAEWGHPSDNLAAILAVADWRSRQGDPWTVADVLTAAIKAHEIQGVLALENSLNRVGLDHVLLVKVASTAAAGRLLGLSRGEMLAALSHAFADGGSLRAYRHAPNTGARKSWAAGDAASRAVRLGLMAAAGEEGVPTVLSASRWGFQDVLFGGRPITLARPLGSYVMEHVLFKIAFPAEFHGQTAVEAAMALHAEVGPRWREVRRIEITTQESGKRIIDKTGPLKNPADRDHCIQYMVAVALLKGTLTDDDYLDEAAADPRIDALREKMSVEEDPVYSRDYLDPEKRSIANAVQVCFGDGTSTQRVEVAYPLGHRRRRKEGIPQLMDKARRNIGTVLSPERTSAILSCFEAPEKLSAIRVAEFMDLFRPERKEGQR